MDNKRLYEAKLDTLKFIDYDMKKRRQNYLKAILKGRSLSSYAVVELARAEMNEEIEHHNENIEWDEILSDILQSEVFCHESIIHWMDHYYDGLGRMPDRHENGIDWMYAVFEDQVWREYNLLEQSREVENLG